MPYTNDFAYVKGQYQFADQCTPYFSIVVPASEAINVFKLARETILDPTSVSLDELFQRQVNKRRVKSELVPYLSRPGSLKFFGALIVALLPYEDQKLGDTFEGEDSIEYSEAKESYIRNIGAIRLIEEKEFVGRLSWDLDKVAAVVIDGQHRFSAIRELASSPGAFVERELATTQLAVTLLILDERVGYSGKEQRMLQAVRRVFVDLNRHAEPVSEARSILLDDFELASVLTRQLFGRTAGKRNDEPLEGPLRLPLALVDWYSEKAKFDAGIHLTTVLCLHSMVKDLLNLPAFDNEDPEQIRKYIDRLCGLLPPSPSERLRLELLRLLTEAQRQGQSFALDAAALNELRSWFATSWGPAIVTVLQGVSCYSSFIESLRRLDIVDGSHEVWAALDEQGKEAYGRERHFEPAKILESLNQLKQNNLFFQVVFQKALILAFSQFHQLSCEGDLRRLTDIQALLRSAADFCSRFNKRLSRVPKAFWIGAGLKADERISWTKASQRAIASAIVSVCYALPLGEWLELPPESRPAASRAWIKELTSFLVVNIRKANPQQKQWCTVLKPWRESLKRTLADAKRIKGQSDFVDTEDITDALCVRFQMLLSSAEEADLKRENGVEVEGLQHTAGGAG